MSERHIPANQVRELCGSVSDMTLWRWLANERLGFPKPKVINRRRYWREADVLAWLNATSEQTAA
jgi:predicted DNA-binding transcriptional regulator AlpA